MKGSPLTIVIIAAVVIIGGSIVTYLLIESSPQEDGLETTNTPDGRAHEQRVPRPNVYEDTEPLPVPTPPLPGNGPEHIITGATTSSQTTKPHISTQPTTGGERVKPVPVPPLPD